MQTSLNTSGSYKTGCLMVFAEMFMMNLWYKSIVISSDLEASVVWIAFDKS